MNSFRATLDALKKLDLWGKDHPMAFTRRERRSFSHKPKPPLTPATSVQNVRISFFAAKTRVQALVSWQVHPCPTTEQHLVRTPVRDAGAIPRNRSVATAKASHPSSARFSNPSSSCLKNLGWSIPASAETSSLYILGPNLFYGCLAKPGSCLVPLHCS